MKFHSSNVWFGQNFPVSCPILLSAFSCIVCLHRVTPHKPSLTLQRLEFGLIYRHQSLFVWMSYGLTLLVCSFVVITKAHTVTGKLPLNCHTTTILFHKDLHEESLDTANTPVSQQPHIPPTVNLSIPLDPLASLQNQTKRSGSKHEGFAEGSGICISHSCSWCVYCFGTILLRIDIFLSSRDVIGWGRGEGY